jgi:hypothetical protein
MRSPATGRQTIERARAAGFDGHFVKPLDLTMLMRAIDH